MAIKLQCPACGFVIRTTRTWLEVGVPICYSGEDFEVATQANHRSSAVR